MLTCDTTYDPVVLGVAQYLLSLQASDGLLTGGPDVSWESSQNNFLAVAFFNTLENLIFGNANEGNGNGGAGSEAYQTCAADQDQQFAGESEEEEADITTQMGNVISEMDNAISSELFVRLAPAQGDDAGTAYFREGVDDDLRPVDAQALGILWLVGQGDLTDAQAVLNYTNQTMLQDNFTISYSTNPLTFNDTYEAAGPFVGYTPYDTLNDPSAPDVLWTSATAARPTRSTPASTTPVTRCSARSTPTRCLTAKRFPGSSDSSRSSRRRLRSAASCGSSTAARYPALR